MATLLHFLSTVFPPPRYLALPTAGVDISTSGIKMALLEERREGLVLSDFAEYRYSANALVDGDIVEREAVLDSLKKLRDEHGIRTANVALPESKSYLFEARIESEAAGNMRLSVEQKLEEYVPLPPAEVVFDIVPVGSEKDVVRVAGVGYARRVVLQFLSLCEEAGISVRALESETFSLPRAVLPRGNPVTVLIIDVGKATTKLSIIAGRIPLYATTLTIGGHALTLAVQKYFGVTEEEATRVKLERGIALGQGNQEYLEAMLSTVSAIREEIGRHLEYWQTKGNRALGHEPVSRAIMVGGNANVRGLPEYFEAGLKIPVTLADVFTNLASRDLWLPSIDYMHSLGYATAIGLALREYAP